MNPSNVLPFQQASVKAFEGNALISGFEIAASLRAFEANATIMAGASQVILQGFETEPVLKGY